MSDTMRMTGDERRAYYDRLQERKLRARVIAVNSANTLAMQLFPVLANILGGYVGQMVYKVDGSLMKKIEDALPNFQMSPGVHIYRYQSSYSLVWIIRVSEYVRPEIEGECGYSMQHEASIYVGNVKNRVLDRINEAPVFRTDYTYEEIKAKRAEHERLSKLKDEAYSNLHPFGEGDR